MTKGYKAAFIVPIGARKILGEDGWEFESSVRLSKDIGDGLIKTLKLTFLEEYSGIRKYAGEGIGMSIVFDDNQEVESIYFQLSGGALASLSEIYQCVNASSEAEIFVP
ncbi:MULTISPECIES: hypothetical protein [unclassified Pseudomonas]|uniref:hypothetical protein n=1 Tax=unclassified Pseudomonas TaxID=196821 RepID=UPI000D37F4C7|nr:MULTISPECIES: hypothetical protein [unclassified Pseudomonas]RAU39808.1 hypothetical protein DBP26_025935 [Pseudomonas sp. RIT 409]RAU45994.1 hypothetical protein DBY65_026030 [Pseudomonas sp. RIT 412]